MKLKDYLDDYGIKPSEFAKKADISRHYVYRLMKAQRIPSPWIQRRIEIASEGKVTKEDWKKEKE